MADDRAGRDEAGVREHARAEMDRARRSLRGAWLLHAEGLHEDAISRSYYASLHAAKAALLAAGITAESHAAVRRLFGKELVLVGGWKQNGLACW